MGFWIEVKKRRVSFVIPFYLGVDIDWTIFKLSKITGRLIFRIQSTALDVGEADRLCYLVVAYHQVTVYWMKRVQEYKGLHL